ncbi:MAG: ECF transporter S component [Clostridia bacterium]|nr:ECF transporter S component [Clostridia bacterium]
MKKTNTFKLTLMALFTAIMLIMNFTPFGYIPTPFFSITLMTIPVALGAVCIGISGGLYLSFLFGLTSFLMCFNIGYLPDRTAPLMFDATPVGTIITCFVPRLIAGLVTALVFWLFKRKGKTGIVPTAFSCALMPILNTTLFLTSYYILFKNTPLAMKGIKALITAAFTINGLAELILTLLVAGAVGRTLNKYMERLSVK